MVLLKITPIFSFSSLSGLHALGQSYFLIFISQAEFSASSPRFKLHSDAVRFSHGSNPGNLRATKPPLFFPLLSEYYPVLISSSCCNIYGPTCSSALCSVFHDRFASFLRQFLLTQDELNLFFFWKPPPLEVKALTTSKRSHHTLNTVWPSVWKDFTLYGKQSNKTNCVNFYRASFITLCVPWQPQCH